MAVPVETGRYRVGDEPAPGYRLIEFLGQGEFGHVWKTASPGGIEVALKIIDLSRTGGSKELRAVRLIKLKRIRHPNLCPVIAFWLKDSSGNILHDADQLVTDGVVDDADGGGGPTQQPIGVANCGVAPSGPVPSRRLSETLDVSDQETTPTRPAPPPTTPPSTPAAADTVSEDHRAVELLIAMGLGDGTLTDRLRAYQAEGHEGIPVDELLDYFEAAANAIDYLNQKHRIQHGDIKPSNVLTVGGAAQVCDFGLAKMIGDMRKTSTALTLAYASPEVFDGKPPSPTSDQYSFAISYVELRNGRLPFASAEPTWTEVCRAKLKGELDLSSLPTAERAVLARATAFAPEDRFPTSLAMVIALRDAQRPPPPSPPSRVGQLIKLAGLVLVAALCTGLLAMLFIPSNRPTNPWQELKQDLNKGQYQLAASRLRDFSHDQRPQAQQ
jgi:serine/threonine protein kinase